MTSDAIGSRTRHREQQSQQKKLRNVYYEGESCMFVGCGYGDKGKRGHTSHCLCCGYEGGLTLVLQGGQLGVGGVALWGVLVISLQR